MAAAVQKPAPEFSGRAVVGEELKEIKLSDYKGKYIVLFFYPLDFTSICSSEITAFSDRAEEFVRRNAQLLAVSVDSCYSHQAWVKTPRERGGLGRVNYPMVSDMSRKISEDYGVLLDVGMALRGLFILDRTQTIRHITINDVPLGRSVDETLRTLDALQHLDNHGEMCPADWKPDASAKRR